jgi:hypothetical protein
MKQKRHRSTVYKGGRCWNGVHRDAGRIVHLIEGKEPNGFWGGKALCGVEPGRGAYGWVMTSRKANCHKCIKKAKQQELQLEHEQNS